MAVTSYTIKAGDKFSPFTGKAINYPVGTVIYGDMSTAQDMGTTKPSSAPTTVSTSNTVKVPETKTTGINSITSTLNFGSQGDQVKALQQYLQGLGYKNADGTPLKVDGIYGNNTKTAVMDFQSKNGLTADGIVGPKTISSLRTVTGDTQANIADTNTITTGNPQNDALLNELSKFYDTQIANGLTPNFDNFDETTLSKFMDAAKSQIHPYYQQQLDTIKEDVLKYAPEILANYNSDVQKAKEDFTQNLKNTREDLAGSGMAYSGFRGQKENSLVNDQNRSLSSLYQNAGNDLYSLGRKAESQIGANNMPDLGSLSNYSATSSGQGGFNLSGTSSPYQSGGYQLGSIPMDEAAAIEERAKAIKQKASEAVTSGRSYQDLFSNF